MDIVYVSQHVLFGNLTDYYCEPGSPGEPGEDGPRRFSGNKGLKGVKGNLPLCMLCIFFAKIKCFLISLILLANRQEIIKSKVITSGKTKKLQRMQILKLYSHKYQYYNQLIALLS